MAAGDITACVIDEEGWNAYITIEGWAGKQGTITYDFGDPDVVGDVAFTVVSEGYTGGVLGTRNRTIYGTETVRKPYPDDADLDEVDSGADLVVRISLAEAIYDDDKDGGAGTSGTDPTVTIAAGWANDGTNDTSAVTGLSCTNNSTLDYPKVVGQWDWDCLRGGWRRMESDFTVGFRAQHGYGIDRVTLSAIGATSAVDTSSNVAAPSKKQSSRTELYGESYQMPVTLADYDQGEQIDLRAIAYPLIGDADSILDTNTVTAAADRIRGLTTCFVMCDKTGAMKTYATVDPDDGDDGTGATNSTVAGADATPYLTVAAARNAGANVINVLDSTAVPDINGAASSTITQGYYVEVQTHPDAAGAATLNRPGTNQAYNTDYLCFTDIGISYTTGSGWLDGANGTRQLLFDNVTFTNNATPTVGLGYRSNGCWFINSTGLGTDDYQSLSTNRVAYSLTGCEITSNFNSDCWYTAIACKNTADANTVIFGNKATANVAPNQDNFFFEKNNFTGLTANGANNALLRLGSVTAHTGISIVGNVGVVSTITASGPIVWAGGDGSAFQLSNIIFRHNTFLGERCNLWYNDQGTAAVYRYRIFQSGNILRSYNIKSDTFASSPDGARVGNWAQMWACDFSDNLYDGSASGQFTGEYDGLRSQFYGGVTTFGEITFVDDNSSDGGSAAFGGDYTPAVGSVARTATIPADKQFLGFDLFGTPATLTEFGAVFIATAVQQSAFISSILADAKKEIVSDIVYD